MKLPTVRSFPTMLALLLGSTKGNSFVITGGAIKLTDQMKDRKHTQEEFYKLNMVRDYLQENGKEGEFVYLDI